MQFTYNVVYFLQEGFLCGNVKKTVKDQITDSDASGNQHELEFGEQYYFT